MSLVAIVTAWTVLNYMIPIWLGYNKSVFPRRRNAHMTVKEKGHHRKTVVMATSRHHMLEELNTLRKYLRV